MNHVTSLIQEGGGGFSMPVPAYRRRSRAAPLASAPQSAYRPGVNAGADAPFGSSATPLVRGMLALCLAVFAALPLAAGGRKAEPPAPAPGGIYSVSPGSGGGRVFTDVLGRRLNVSGKFSRIVSLSPAVTEILFAVGAGGETIGITEYCDYPPEAQDRTRVGGFSGATVSVDQIASLKPDLVILSGEMHGRIISLLDEISIASFAVEPQNFAQTYETIEIIGELTGCAPGAAAVVKGMKDKLDQAAKRIAGKDKPAVFWMLSEDPLMSVGGKTFISEAVSLGGGRNIFEELEESWPMISAEQVLLREPAWILIGDDMGPYLDLQALGNRPGWAEIPAIKNNRVVLVNAGALYRYGPRLADGVLTIAGTLHP